jgi:two-component sensor histidine kinase
LQEGADLLFRIGPMHDSSMQGRILAPHRFQVAASPAYLQRHGTPQHPNDSLQIIASVLMQSARKVQSEESRVHLNDAHHRVMSIATLQKQLAASRLGEVALRPYFADLCASIGASMISRDGRLSLTTTADEAMVPADVSMSLGLIVTELVINRLKHAFPSHDPAGSVAVGYLVRGGGWTLSVADNGAGMPRGRKRAKPSLGTGIVEALARQLDAKVIIKDERPGTKVSIVHG